ncbi:MAG: homoserine dehydrogenase [Candidatus Methanomethyliaceae archaeon]|nr:homoserine dehydrogenase [Candidatus Methanomethyliaceae archaeon]
MHFDLVFVGFGTVGRGLADLLIEKRSLLEKAYGIKWRVVAISDLKLGSIIDDNGINLAEALRLADSGRNLESLPAKRKGLSALEVIKESSANTIIEVTWTNIVDGEPGYTHVKTALSLGKNVVTTNKGPIALYYRELMDLAKEKGVHLRFKGTVLSGTPAFNLFDGPLSGCSVQSIRGILNGTTNFILTEMEKGADYASALKEAQRLGYAEADPTMDVEGMDAAAKVAILANALLGADIKPGDVKRRGISSITPQDIQNAARRGERIKLIGRAEMNGGKILAEVLPTSLPTSDPLANIMGVTNAITFKTDCLGDVTVVGPGAGRRATGYALLTDLISIARSK